MNEYPSLNCTLIDLASDPDTREMPLRLENELLRPDGESEIILADLARYTLVMSEEEKDSPFAQVGDSRFRPDFHVPGKLRNAIWLPDKERILQDEEIEVRIHTAGLNFRDVMYLMGLLPDEAVESGFAGANLGLEFSGIVTRVGVNAGDYRPGDAVMGFGSSCFASHVVTHVGTVMPVPDNWSFEAAATVPTVYFSVYYALCHLADLQPGERVLIHGAAGGVGIAAIQLARHLGAEIFATAGSDEKRDFVRLLGADHVFDSRSLAFADEIFAVTGGEGVDVVLNSLSGEAIRRNLRVLKPFGRFLELGKRDFFENTPLGLRYFKDNISYFAIDIDQLFLGRPALGERLFRELVKLFRDGVLTPLPFRVFNANRIVDAFYEMMEARHIGKVVISLDNAKPRIQQPVDTPQPLTFDSASTWLVTGGLDGFGLESARWLAGRGAGNLVLIGRRGTKTPGALQAITELVDQGVNVVPYSCDVTDAKALSAIISQVCKTMPPLTGILHAAMVIDDQMIVNLNVQGIDSVLRPKLIGAWNLHSLTLDIPLKYFILYSSITTAIGNPGQANYVIGNSSLEGLAQMRRHMGLPATCIGWGPIGDTGYLSRNTAVRNSLGMRLGKAPLSAGEALNQLDRILAREDNVCLSVAQFDWGVLSAVLPSAASSRFAVLNESLSDTSILEKSTDFSALLTSKAPEEISGIVRNLVIQEIAQVLLIKTDRIDEHSSLHDLGLDSLMAVELALGLEQRFGIQLPIMMFNESPTAARVTACIIEKLIGETSENVDNSAETLIHDVLSKHGDEMTQSNIPALIANNLAFARVDGEQLP
jgi:NADPH:quinone reductase-like Zn-dependent oxidoreductase/acyl carrier protein